LKLGNSNVINTEVEIRCNHDNIYIFKDYPQILPNLSPKEILQDGSFGGTYFLPIYSTVTSKSYGAEV